MASLPAKEARPPGRSTGPPASEEPSNNFRLFVSALSSLHSVRAAVGFAAAIAVRSDRLQGQGRGQSPQESAVSKASGVPASSLCKHSPLIKLEALAEPDTQPAACLGQKVKGEKRPEDTTGARQMADDSSDSYSAESQSSDETFEADSSDDSEDDTPLDQRLERRQSLADRSQHAAAASPAVSPHSAKIHPTPSCTGSGIFNQQMKGGGGMPHKLIRHSQAYTQSMSRVEDCLFTPALHFTLWERSAAISNNLSFPADT
ncbi:hypothetical protein MMC29_000178 [Sticta canariensis]|nr:hypothetical protein [Sticta canariensis]